MGKILCATRGGEAAVRAQETAIGLAKDRGDALLFFFVVDTDFLQRSVAAVRPDIVQAELESMGEFLLAVAQERAQKQSVEAEIMVRSGYLRDELLTAIRKEDVTTVVLGTPTGPGSVFVLEGLQALAEGIADESGVKVVIAGSQNDEEQG